MHICNEWRDCFKSEVAVCKIYSLLLMHLPKSAKLKNQKRPLILTNGHDYDYDRRLWDVLELEKLQSGPSSDSN